MWLRTISHSAHEISKVSLLPGGYIEIRQMVLTVSGVVLISHRSSEFNIHHIIHKSNLKISCFFLLNVKKFYIFVVFRFFTNLNYMHCLFLTW